MAQAIGGVLRAGMGKTCEAKDGETPRAPASRNQEKARGSVARRHLGRPRSEEWRTHPDHQHGPSRQSEIYQAKASGFKMESRGSYGHQSYAEESQPTARTAGDGCTDGGSGRATKRAKKIKKTTFPRNPNDPYQNDPEMLTCVNCDSRSGCSRSMATRMTMASIALAASTPRPDLYGSGTTPTSADGGCMS